MPKLKRNDPLRDLLDKLREAETTLERLSREIGSLRDQYELPLILKEVRRLVRGKKVRTVSSSWLQRRFKIGYLNAATILEKLQNKKADPTAISTLQRRYNIGYAAAARLKEELEALKSQQPET